MLFILLLVFVFVQLQASPIWWGILGAMLFFHLRSAYRAWRHQQVMAEALQAAFADLKEEPAREQEPAKKGPEGE